MTNRRKELLHQYKERKRVGCVYTITNTQSGKYLLGSAADTKSVQNRFQFALLTGSTLHPLLQKDWKTLGAQAFTLTILAELEQKPEQSQAQFRDDLKMLEDMWRTQLDSSKAY